MAGLRRLVSSIKSDRVGKSPATTSEPTPYQTATERSIDGRSPWYDLGQSATTRRKLQKKQPTAGLIDNDSSTSHSTTPQPDYFGHSFYSPGEAVGTVALPPVTSYSASTPSTQFVTDGLVVFAPELPPPYTRGKYEIPPLPTPVLLNSQSSSLQDWERNVSDRGSDGDEDIRRVVRTDSGMGLEDETTDHRRDDNTKVSAMQDNSKFIITSTAGQITPLVVEDSAPTSILPTAAVEASIPSNATSASRDDQPTPTDDSHPFTPVNLRTCIVCHNSLSPLDFPVRQPTTRCVHPVMTCTACLRTWIATELHAKGSTNIQCSECTESLSYDEVRQAASSEIFDAYDRAFTRHTLTSLDGFAWCSASGCSSGQVNDNGAYMNCVACGWEQCLVHEMAWHEGETCTQFDLRARSGFRRLTDEHHTQASLDALSKPCPGPGCGWRIQKTGGCDHMTCNKCRHEFCYSCLASQHAIRREGNTAHKRHCRHHTDNLERYAQLLASLD